MGSQTAWQTERVSRTMEAYDTVDALSVFMRLHRRFSVLAPMYVSPVVFSVARIGSCGIVEGNSICTVPTATTVDGQD